MAAMNIPLPDPMRADAQARIEDGRGRDMASCIRGGPSVSSCTASSAPVGIMTARRG
jgi:hypothetical protein